LYVVFGWAVRGSGCGKSSWFCMALVLIEDFDSYFDGRKVLMKKSSLTFSGFLNAINGVMTSPGRILIMTTNKVDNVDPALTRVGRIDRAFHVGYCDESQIVSFLGRFIPDIDMDSDKVKSFVKSVVDGEVTPADITGHLQRHCKDEFVLDVDTILSDRHERNSLAETIKNEAKEQLKRIEKEEDKVA